MKVWVDYETDSEDEVVRILERNGFRIKRKYPHIKAMLVETGKTLSVKSLDALEEVKVIRKVRPEGSLSFFRLT